MDSLLKQVRVRFSGQETSEEPRSARERRIPSLKTPSFKEENTRPQNWFRRQFSGQMNQDHDSNRIEQAIAVAAAAYAITSQQEKTSKGPQSSGEGSMRNPESHDSKVPETATKEKTSREVGAAAPKIKKTPTFTDSQSSKSQETAIKEKTSSEVAAAAPTIKRTLSFTDKPAPSMKKTPTFSESAEPVVDMPTTKPKITVPKPDLPPTIKPATPPTRPGIGGIDADAWERAELSKIQKRYEQTNARILSWENKRKEKAKNRLKKTESDLEQIRSKALKKFHAEMVGIDQIAGRARAKAAERQRNEEFKAKEKANTIRRTGKLPRTCFCF